MITLIITMLTFPALAEGPSSTSVAVMVPTGSVVTTSPDGTTVVTPPDSPAMASAKVAAIMDPTSSSNVVGRAAVTTRTNPEELSVCGFGMETEAFSGRQQRRLAPFVPDCLRAQATLVDAVNRGEVAEKAIDKGIDFHSEGDELATGNAASTAAVTDDEGGNAFGGYGGFGGAGVPYGQSVIGTFQQNALATQGLIASQQAVIVQRPVVSKSNTNVSTTAATPVDTRVADAFKAAADATNK